MRSIPFALRSMLALLGTMGVEQRVLAAEPELPGEDRSSSSEEAGPARDASATPRLSKKATLLRDKAERADRRATTAPRTGSLAEPVLSIRNVWTHEVVPISADRSPPMPFEELARCHFTNQPAPAMDPRLLEVVLRAARRFGARYVELVSGYRAPKYQLMLRKKGREVARTSQHPLGQAVDFRIPAVSTKLLLGFVRSLRIGGVGYYPQSGFVHADVGRVRFWKGR